MNDDLISRSELRARFQEILDRGDMFCEYDIIGMVDNAPAVDVKPFASFTFDKDELDRIVEERVIQPIKNGELVIKEEKPKGEWIHVSERLPIRNGCYNVTRIIEGTAISGVCYFDGSNTWHADTGVNHGRPYLTDIIAWQPLPEP